MIEQVESYFRSQSLIETHENYREMITGAHGNRSFSYMGINFSNSGIHSVKFYFHVLKKLSLPETELFLPRTDDFEPLYLHYEAPEDFTLNNTGCAFELKFYSDDFPVRGFHLRLRPTDEVKGLLYGTKGHESLDMNCLLWPGISYEYHENRVVSKSYRYFTSDDEIAFFADRFGANFVKYAKCVEYSEGMGFSKINTWGADKWYFERHNTLGPTQRMLIEELCRKHRLIPMAMGLYRNLDIKSVYLVSNAYGHHEKRSDYTGKYVDTIGNIIGLSATHS